jgi:broad specificity phosphatase PhoE
MDAHEYREFTKTKSLIDPPLLKEGVKQCEAAQVIANGINVSVVFVSPMLRTCETAIHTFKTHPNRKNIKFLVLPSLKEGLNVCND